MVHPDHGVRADELPVVSDSLARWLPYLHSVVEASRRLKGGERISIGARELEVGHTPGHSLGHTCLWSPIDGLLFSGDHLLGGVSPPVTSSRVSTPTRWPAYLDSLRQVADYRPRLVLPGHGQPFAEGGRRADAIIRNKLRRLDAIRAMIEREPCTMTDIADRLVA